MSDLEDVKRSVAQAFSTVVRNSSVSGKLDPQQMMMVLSSLLGPLKKGEPLDLTLLAEYLKTEKRLMGSEIEELLVLFHARQEQLGFELLMPLSMRDISDARRDKILEKFAKSVLHPTFSGNKTASASASATTQARETTSSYDRKPKGPAGTLQRKQLIAAAVFIVLGGAFAAYQIATLPEPPKSITLRDSKASLMCLELKLSKTTAFCSMDPKQAAKYEKSERGKRIEAALVDLRSQGIKVTRMVLLSTETGGRL